MTHSFAYHFDELPLIVRDGYDAALICGEAEISYSYEDDFSVGDVAVEGWRRRENSILSDRKAVGLASDEPLAIWIRHRLENECRQWVLDAIDDDIRERREYAAETAAEHRADQRREGV